MKLYYIGTGAADWTELAGPRDGIMRRFSAAILDEQLLIDLAPATPMSYFEKGGVGEEVTYVLYTHSHNDHYGSGALLNLCEKGKVTVLCHFTARLPEHPNLTSIQAKVGEEVHLGKYSVTPVRANHRVASHPEEQAMH
ncbi:MAG: MBL fold metallo-hydrolase, partial [Clostridia bacterium]|nr:MBL fold metallo-hydrolase [Clostridia bacterium]